MCMYVLHIIHFYVSNLKWTHVLLVYHAMQCMHPLLTCYTSRLHDITVINVYRTTLPHEFIQSLINYNTGT